MGIIDLSAVWGNGSGRQLPRIAGGGGTRRFYWPEYRPGRIQLCTLALGIWWIGPGHTPGSAWCFDWIESIKKLRCRCVRYYHCRRQQRLLFLIIILLLEVRRYTSDGGRVAVINFGGRTSSARGLRQDLPEILCCAQMPKKKKKNVFFVLKIPYASYTHTHARTANISPLLSPSQLEHPITH